MVNIDGNSNRVSCIAQGPKKVIIIAGMNKVCSDLDAAMKRARNVAAPANAQRFDIKTPCKEKGKCFDCKSPGYHLLSVSDHQIFQTYRKNPCDSGERESGILKEYL